MADDGVTPVELAGEAQALIAPLVGWRPEDAGGYAVLVQRRGNPAQMAYATTAETAADLVAFLRRSADSIEAQC